MLIHIILKTLQSIYYSFPFYDNDPGSEGLATIKGCYYHIIVAFLSSFFLVIMQTALNITARCICMKYYMLRT